MGRLPTSVGVGWQKGPRDAPTVVNAVFSAAKLCDGGADDQKIQVKGLVQAGVEMANEPENVVTLIQHAKLLRALRPCVGPQLPSVQYATIKRIESIS